MVEILHEEHDKILIISIVGDFIFNDTRDAELKFQELVKTQPEVVGINCSKLRTLDSSGLGVFIKFNKIAQSLGFELLFVDISDHVSALFDLSKLQNLFTIISMHEFENLYL